MRLLLILALALPVVVHAQPRVADLPQQRHRNVLMNAGILMFI